MLLIPCPNVARVLSSRLAAMCHVPAVSSHLPSKDLVMQNGQRTPRHFKQGPPPISRPKRWTPPRQTERFRTDNPLRVKADLSVSTHAELDGLEWIALKAGGGNTGGSGRDTLLGRAVRNAVLDAEPQKPRERQPVAHLILDLFVGQPARQCRTLSTKDSAPAPSPARRKKRRWRASPAAARAWRQPDNPP
jgi:hypothetical protein